MSRPYLGARPLTFRETITEAKTGYTVVDASTTKKIVVDRQVVAVPSTFAPAGARFHGTTNSGPMIRVSSTHPTFVTAARCETDINDALKITTDGACDIFIEYHTEDDRSK